MKKKISLNQLKVKSFVTNDESNLKETVKGGIVYTCDCSNTACGTFCVSEVHVPCGNSVQFACID